MWIAPAIASAATILLALSTSRNARRVRRADSPAVVRFAAHRLVDQPPADSSPAVPLTVEQTLDSCAPLRGGPGRFSTRLRRCGRPLAAARQLSGVSRAPPVAHRTSPTNIGTGAAGQSVRLRLRLSAGRGRRRAHDQHPAHDGRARAATSGHFYNWYDTQHAAAAAAAAMCRRWTAATWPATC
jgi:hypothetical protein